MDLPYNPISSYFGDGIGTLNPILGRGLDSYRGLFYFLQEVKKI